MENEELTDEVEYTPPFWRCEECGYENHKRQMPNREKFYASGKAKICPKCKSEAFMPVGF